MAQNIYKNIRKTNKNQHADKNTAVGLATHTKHTEEQIKSKAKPSNNNKMPTGMSQHGGI